MLADYEHIIVDEVQDLVGSRAELVLAMLKGLPETCGFTILGDSCQALYDYMAEDDPAVMSSEQFYQEIFKSFPDANYYALTENHRQGNTFGQLTVPYRKAILTGSTQERVSAANDLLAHIPKMPVKLTKFSRSDALRYVGQGETLGILTRTNGQALQISAWLQNADVPHALHRGLGSPTLGDWIARIFCDYENESIDEPAFVAKHLALFPDAAYELARMRWAALVSTQHGEARNRYEVADLLKGLLRNAREPMLFESGTGAKPAITVSNIHRAKGKEFDSVIVIDDVIEAMADPDTEDLLEHKVCYVALTRPKKKVERAEISKKDKQIYITRNDDQSKRCAKAGGFKRYISHFEVGSDTDLDLRSLAADSKLQQYIQKNIHSGMRLKLIKCPEGTKPYWEGKSVLYLCFNHNIAQYVQYQFEKDNVCIEAVTLHAFMMRACGIDWSPDLNRDFYETELPVAFMAAEDVPVYDLVIIDEGQDLLTDTYLECIDRIVQDGLGDGTWAIYYDPNQNIFNSYAELDAMIKKLRKEAYAMSWKLRANCRNTKQIANANILMTNIPNQGKPTVSGPQVEYDSYSGKEDERKKINAIVRKIKDSGAIGSDFIILSRYTLANPLNGLGLTGLDKDLGTLKTTGPLWKAKKNDVRFSTISGFKGLEAKIVIMIDVDHFSDEDTRLLNYVAASRACAMLYVLYDSDAEQERQNMILSGFTQVGT